MTPTTAVQFSSPGLTWCRVKALQDHETVINVIYAVVGGTEKFSEVAKRTREMAQRRYWTVTCSMPELLLLGALVAEW